MYWNKFNPDYKLQYEDLKNTIKAYGNKMKTELDTVNNYQIVRILQEIPRDNDFSKLKKTVYSILEDGNKNIAISFSKDTYLYSRTIAVLVQFLGLVKEKDGNFAVVHPDPKMLKSLKMIGLSFMMQLCTEEKSIGVFN